MRRFTCRQILGVVLIASVLNLTPVLSVYAQQPVKNDNAKSKANTSSHADQKIAKHKLDLIAGNPLSEAEMDQVEGGAVVPIALGAAGLGLAIYNTWQNHRSHKKLLEACKVKAPPRRR